MKMNLTNIEKACGRYNCLQLLLLLGFYLFSISFTTAQTGILEIEIDLPEQKTNVGDFLKRLSKESEIIFSYGSNVNKEKEVNLPSKKQSIRNFLDDIFKGDSLTYTEKYKKIIIAPSNVRTGIQKNNIRGTVVDIDSNIPLVGANVYIDSGSPSIGSVTDDKGQFAIMNIPIGRYNLKVSYIGYKTVLVSNILLLSAKEQVVDIKMEELITNLEGVEIVSITDRSKPLNDMAFVSSRQLSSAEMENYPGSLNDLSRAAVSFSGVLSDNDGQNHLIIRGNSPKGLQWRLEGIEIPNLNHFAEIGSSGGGIGIVSNNMIGKSDFIMSAFPSEYGNALSGVFDLSMRTGNQEKHEQTFQISLIGTELMVEGPLNRNSNATYIAQYRFATFKLIETLGIEQNSIPEFQDISFKFHLPTKKAGSFSIFGIGGLSREVEKEGYDWGSNMATFGISNNYIFNSKTQMKSIVAFTGWHYDWKNHKNIGSPEFPIDYELNDNVNEYAIRSSINLHHKINTKHKLKMGFVFDNTFYDTYMEWHSDTLYTWWQNTEHPNHSDDITFQYTYSDEEGTTQTIQAYGSWRYRITQNLILSSGLHYIYYYLNNNYSVEPRLGISWNFLQKHTLSGGFGLHSRKESITLYTGQKTLHDGEVIQPNKNLELTKAMHFIVAYDIMLKKNLMINTEIYYQYLYDIPVYPFPPYFSTINFDYGFEGNILVNEGTAFNKGIELTIEKFFSNGYHFLANGTIYDSKYKNYLGEEYNTKYNGSYAIKGLFLKEFKVGKNKTNLIVIGTRGIFMGGMRYMPIDLEASLASNREVKIWDNGYTEKANDYIRFDLQFSFKRNHQKYTSEWSLDIINITNQKNMRWIRYNNNLREIETEYQNPIIPMLSYRIKF